MRKNILLSIIVLLLLLSGCQKKSNKFTVGVLQWADHPALQVSYVALKEKLGDLDPKGNIVIKHEVANEDMGQARMISQKFVQDGVDLIYAIATPSAQAAKKIAEENNIPIIFSAVSDPLAAGLLENDKNPEGLITGTSDLPPLNKQIDLILEILPELKTLGLIYNTGEVNSANQVLEVSKIVEASKRNVKVVGISSSSELASGSAQVVKDSDAVFVVNDNMVVSGLSLLISVANKNKIPVFIAEESPFDQGILASESISYEALAHESAQMIYDVLINNKEISQLPVKRAEETILIYSEKVADKLEISLPDSVISRGESR